MPIPESQIHAQESDLTNLIHNHVSISPPSLTPTQLASLSLAAPPAEVRLHFWAQRAGFPTIALRFCTHLDYEQTARYDGKTFTHSPEQRDALQPSHIACGGPPTRFILELNRVVWEELQSPVLRLTPLRLSVAAKIERILERISETHGSGGHNRKSKGKECAEYTGEESSGGNERAS